ncbi:MAG: hypothetical protein ACOC4G_14715, partial [Bacillota bacterium]
MLVNKERTLFLLKVVIMVLVSLILLNVSTVVMAQQEDDVWITVDQTSEEVEFNEGNVSQWNTASVEEAFGGSHTISVRKDYAAEFTFEGSEIRWIGSRGPARGKADVYLDGELVAENLDTYAEEEKFNSVIFSKEVDPGTHTIEVIPTGEKNDKSLHHTIGIEGFAYLPTMDSLRNEFSKVVEDIENKLDSVSDKPGLGDKLKSFYSLEDRMELQEALVRGEVKGKNVDQDLKELSMIIDEMKKARDNFLETAQNPVFTDKTANEFNGFLEGEPVWVKGVMGNAVDLDGEDDYINSEKLPSQLGVDGKNPKTVEMWAFTRSDGGLFQMGQQA